VYHGRPDEVIVETTIAKKADLIVIGSHGRTGLDRVMLGSVSERVIDAASTAVLVAKIS
jgi:nucleotide-binding universal stress UspA family protein